MSAADVSVHARRIPSEARGRGRHLLAVAPLRVEAGPVRRGAPDADVVVSGFGPTRARRAVQSVVQRAGDAAAVAVVGFAGGLDPALRPGDVVVASEVRDAAGAALPLPSAPLVMAALARSGLHAVTGPVVSVGHVVRGRERARLAETGACAVDMESMWLAAGVTGDRETDTLPLAVVRVIVDTADHPVLSPATLRHGLHARRVLEQVAAALAGWADAVSPRTVLLASPRSFCAGVERAIEIVQRALERFGRPVFVRRQLVHNAHVVAELEGAGVVFVEDLDEVPSGSVVVLAAHGVAPAVRVDAERRGLRVIDATCPLVAKVHGEARRFAAHGFEIVLVGHADHEEVQGTVAEAPDRIQVVSSPGAVEGLPIDNPERVADPTQTTLAVDEVAEVVDALRARFPAIVGPNSSDICFASQNRQEAVRVIARECDVVLVVGSSNSSNAQRLVEVARREGTDAFLVEDERAIDLRWIADATSVGISAAASAPESLVGRVVDALGALGPVTVAPRPITHESVHFTLPPEVR